MCNDSRCSDMLLLLPKKVTCYVQGYEYSPLNSSIYADDPMHLYQLERLRLLEFHKPNWNSDLLITVHQTSLVKIL